ncbi:glycosyltransferase [Limosilactobacillus reuteri subsp. suis]|uniref:glycosyltransferase n=1 Tax=Limosilactobacillus reuteri TaxID=1598 RepID=UPI003991FEC4
MGSKDKTVNAIIVTYNRKIQLLRCIKKVMNQDAQINNLIIVDNASTDNTLEEVFNYFDCHNLKISVDKLTKIACQKKINVYVYRCSTNGGGSYGFYTGMKLAYEKLNTDLYWMMDDDGFPAENCLAMLKKEIDNYDYVMPASIDIDDHSKLSWPVRKRNRSKTILHKELKTSWGEIMPYVTPFNGVLLSNNCIKKVGYVNKDFFIWGDEYDHYWRCKQHNIEPVTLLNAIFYHPSQKLPLVKICFGLFSAPYVDSKLRMICLARNYTYIYKHYGQVYKIPLKFIQYTWLFLITRHFDFEGWKLYIESVHDGLIENFDRHKKYLKG